MHRTDQKNLQKAFQKTNEKFVDLESHQHKLDKLEQYSRGEGLDITGTPSTIDNKNLESFHQLFLADFKKTNWNQVL